MVATVPGRHARAHIVTSLYGISDMRNHYPRTLTFILRVFVQRLLVVIVFFLVSGRDCLGVFPIYKNTTTTKPKLDFIGLLVGLLLGDLPHLPRHQLVFGVFNTLVFFNT